MKKTILKNVNIMFFEKNQFKRILKTYYNSKQMRSVE